MGSMAHSEAFLGLDAKSSPKTEHCIMPRIVTSFSEQGYEVYGKRFVETFQKYMKNFTLAIYSEHDVPDSKPFSNRSLEHMHEIAINAKIMRSKMPEAARTNYRYQAERFCYKPFALAEEYDIDTRESLYWFDADVEFTATPTEEQWKLVEAKWQMLRTLTRTKQAHSEAGFIGIGANNTHFMNMWLDFYRRSTIFKLREWHDVMAMDVAASMSGTTVKGVYHDESLKHPWPTSALAKFSIHHKGPGRKQEAYNNTVSDAIVTEERFI